MFKIDGECAVLQGFKIKAEPETEGQGDGALIPTVVFSRGANHGKPRATGVLTCTAVGCTTKNGHFGNGSGKIEPQQTLVRENGLATLVESDRGECRGFLLHPDPKVKPVNCRCKLTFEQSGDTSTRQLPGTGATAIASANHTDGERTKSGENQARACHVRVRIVNQANGGGIANVVLDCRCDETGNTVRQETDANGIAEFTGLGGGPYRVSCPLTVVDFNSAHPIHHYKRRLRVDKRVSLALTSSARGHYALVKLHRYKVRNGDSLPSLAKEICEEAKASTSALSGLDLAFFNWLTRKPREINEKLRNEVGCRKKRRGNYYFSDSDDPGTILLPRLWSEHFTESDCTFSVDVPEYQEDEGLLVVIKLDLSKIPEVKCSLTHTVRSGETLSQIAEKQETTVGALLAINPEISDPNIVYAGQEIRLPTPQERVFFGTTPQWNRRLKVIAVQDALRAERIIELHPGQRSVTARFPELKRNVDTWVLVMVDDSDLTLAELVQHGCRARAVYVPESLTIKNTKYYTKELPKWIDRDVLLLLHGVAPRWDGARTTRRQTNHRPPIPDWTIIRKPKRYRAKRRITVTLSPMFPLLLHVDFLRKRLIDLGRQAYSAYESALSTPLARRAEMARLCAMERAADANRNERKYSGQLTWDLVRFDGRHERDSPFLWITRDEWIPSNDDTTKTENEPLILTSPPAAYSKLLGFTSGRIRTVKRLVNLHIPRGPVDMIVKQEEDVTPEEVVEIFAYDLVLDEWERCCRNIAAPIADELTSCPYRQKSVRDALKSQYEDFLVMSPHYCGNLAGRNHKQRKAPLLLAATAQNAAIEAVSGLYEALSGCYDILEILAPWCKGSGIDTLFSHPSEYACDLMEFLAKEPLRGTYENASGLAEAQLESSFAFLRRLFALLATRRGVKTAEHLWKLLRPADARSLYYAVPPHPSRLGMILHSLVDLEIKKEAVRVKIGKKFSHVFKGLQFSDSEVKLEDGQAQNRFPKSVIGYKSISAFRLAAAVNAISTAIDDDSGTLTRTRAVTEVLRLVNDEILDSLHIHFGHRLQVSTIIESMKTAIDETRRARDAQVRLLEELTTDTPVGNRPIPSTKDVVERRLMIQDARERLAKLDSRLAHRVQRRANFLLRYSHIERSSLQPVARIIVSFRFIGTCLAVSSIGFGIWNTVKLLCEGHGASSGFALLSTVTAVAFLLLPLSSPLALGLLGAGFLFGYGEWYFMNDKLLENLLPLLQKTEFCGGHAIRFIKDKDDKIQAIRDYAKRGISGSDVSSPKDFERSRADVYLRYGRAFEVRRGFIEDKLRGMVIPCLHFLVTRFLSGRTIRIRRPEQCGIDDILMTFRTTGRVNELGLTYQEKRSLADRVELPVQLVPDKVVVLSRYMRRFKWFSGLGQEQSNDEESNHNDNDVILPAVVTECCGSGRDDDCQTAEVPVTIGGEVIVWFPDNALRKQKPYYRGASSHPYWDTPTPTISGIELCKGESFWSEEFDIGIQEVTRSSESWRNEFRWWKIDVTKSDGQLDFSNFEKPFL